MDSRTLLAILLALGAGAFGVVWGVKEGAVARWAVAERDADLEELDSAIGELRGEVEAKEAEIRQRDDEAARLRSDLELANQAAEEQRKAAQRAELQLESFLAGGGSDVEDREWSDEELDRRRETETGAVLARERTMPGPLGYRFTDWEGMRDAYASLPLVVPEQAAEDMSRAYAAMGFVARGTDVRERTLDFYEGQSGAALYTGAHRMLFHEDGTTRSIHSRTALAAEITRYIDDSRGGIFAKLREVPDNADARIALWALSSGSATLARLRFQLNAAAAAPAGDDFLQGPVKANARDFEERIPTLLYDELLFPYAVGESFCQALMDDDNRLWDAVDDALAAPPSSTSLILHPELYLAQRQGIPFAPERYEWMGGLSELPGGLRPIWIDTAGELRIALLFIQDDFRKRMLDANQPDITEMPSLFAREDYSDFHTRPGAKAAAGWLGDRYLVYPAGDASEHVAWRSHWTTPEDADEFVAAVRASLAFRHKADPPDGADRWQSDTGRTLIVTELTETEVLVIDAADAATADVLLTQFSRRGATTSAPTPEPEPAPPADATQGGDAPSEGAGESEDAAGAGAEDAPEAEVETGEGDAVDGGDATGTEEAESAPMPSLMSDAPVCMR